MQFHGAPRPHDSLFLFSLHLKCNNTLRASSTHFNHEKTNQISVRKFTPAGKTFKVSLSFTAKSGQRFRFRLHSGKHLNFDTFRETL